VIFLTVSDLQRLFIGVFGPAQAMVY